MNLYPNTLRFFSECQTAYILIRLLLRDSLIRAFTILSSISIQILRTKAIKGGKGKYKGNSLISLYLYLDDMKSCPQIKSMIYRSSSFPYLYLVTKVIVYYTCNQKQI